MLAVVVWFAGQQLLMMAVQPLTKKKKKNLLFDRFVTVVNDICVVCLTERGHFGSISICFFYTFVQVVETLLV